VGNDDGPIRPSELVGSGPRYWRSLDERRESATDCQSASDEFSSETLDDSLPTTTLTRRGFLGLVGATAAIATAACSSNDRTIVPYTKRPQEIVPGVANYYASTFPEGARSYSVLVKTREGRPIHITGNDEDPRLKGKTSIRATADLMALYDPDRLRAPLFEQRPTSWVQVEKALGEIAAAAKRDRKPILLLSGATNSPTRRGLLAALRDQLPTLDHWSWEPGFGDAAQHAARAAFGTPVRTRLRLSHAKVLVSLGADFLNGDDPEAIGSFASQRRPNEPVDEMSRLWAFEGPLSLTGAKADRRYPVKPSQLAALAFALAQELQARHGFALPAGASLPPVGQDLVHDLGIPGDAWHELATDLARARSDAVVLCGDTMPAETQVAAHLLNAMLGSQCLDLIRADALATSNDLQAVLQALESGRYSAVIVWGVNPAYAYPDAVRWGSAFRKVPQRIWIGTIQDESAEQCQWNLPENHWLESWGDFGEPALLTLQQPAISPLYDTRQGEDLLVSVLRSLGATDLPDYHAYLKARWRREVYPSDSPVSMDRFFDAVLHDGVLHRELVAPEPPAFRADAVAEMARRAFEKRSDGDFELVVHPSTQLYDGRYANNGWLQELPDPITKNTWSNPITVSVEDGARLGLKNGDLVELAINGIHLNTPVLVQPGQARGVLAVALGYGRKHGTIARGVGINAFPLLGVDTSSPNIRQRVSIKRLHGSVRLALTQSHHRMQGRELVRSLTPAEFASESERPRKKVKLTTLYPDQEFPEHKWGMVIDLSACVGCSACVIACQSENNIATVGPEQVERGREMHWLRIDSYYEGPEANPTVVHQPMLCQHCDSAPCENVCPVNATNHSPDGLNQMAYNRCVGTRYCANNCPYKVRRYNFFDYTSDKTEPSSLIFNPEVTVRPRGVMEKCSFCVQRIEDGRMRARADKREMRDGDVIPACAAACPSEAIVFGDLKNPKSRVSELSGVKRSYKVLDELGTRPAVTYLANLRNPGTQGDSHE
jgi:MoCo/4Fe-4S cofactor protein with predicted Tat translocation signal